MFHLTRYKYWFFGVSLAVIVPGLLALMFWHLNLGIDFTGGSLIEMRFASAQVTTDNVRNAFTAAKAKDVNVYAVSDLSSNTKTAQYVYITFDKPIGDNISQAVQQRLGDPKYGGGAIVDKVYPNIPASGSTPASALMVVHFSQAVDSNSIKSALQNLPQSDQPSVTNTAANGSSSATPAPTATGGPTSGASGQKYTVNVAQVTPQSNSFTYQVDTQSTLDVAALNQIVFGLSAKYGPAYVQSKTTTGASIGQETTRNAFLAVALAATAILLYIAFAFRKIGSVAQSFRFGASAIVALLHDVLVVLGVWAILGHFFDFKVDSLFLTAVLTVIGFSVHDTIVVFDRIRENLRRRTSESFEQITNASLVQTMARSLNTSLTVLLTLSALTLFGGVTIREFTLALLIGILSGTYSSIFNASMLLVVWETGEWRRWFGLKKAQTAPSSRRTLAGTRA